MLLPVQSPELECLGLIVTHFDGCRCMSYSFGVGKTETEGIYSLRAVSRADGIPKDTIVAFEDIEDAQR